MIFLNLIVSAEYNMLIPILKINTRSKSLKEWPNLRFWGKEMIAFERYGKKDDLSFGFWEKEMVASSDQWRIQKKFPKGPN